MAFFASGDIRVIKSRKGEALLRHPGNAKGVIRDRNKSKRLPFAIPDSASSASGMTRARASLGRDGDALDKSAESASLMFAFALRVQTIVQLKRRVLASGLEKKKRGGNPPCVMHLRSLCRHCYF